MDIEKEREAFSRWVLTHPDNLDITSYEENIMFDAWQAAKAQAIPDRYKVVPVNYECVWCGCTELDGWTDEAMLEAQEQSNV